MPTGSFTSPALQEAAHGKEAWANVGKAAFKMFRRGVAMALLELWANDAFGAATREQLVGIAEIHGFELSDKTCLFAVLMDMIMICAGVDYEKALENHTEAYDQSHSEERPRHP